MNMESKMFVLIPAEELAFIKSTQAQILKFITELKSAKQPDWIAVKNITALEFMKAVRIKRTKFDQLVNESRIKVIKKKRKIYVPVSEIDRYFSDSSIQ